MSSARTPGVLQRAFPMPRYGLGAAPHVYTYNPRRRPTLRAIRPYSRLTTTSSPGAWQVIMLFNYVVHETRILLRSATPALLTAFGEATLPSAAAIAVQPFTQRSHTVHAWWRRSAEFCSRSTGSTPTSRFSHGSCSTSVNPRALTLWGLSENPSISRCAAYSYNTCSI